MVSTNKVILIGDGEHAAVVQSCIRKNDDWEIIAKLDDRYVERFEEGHVIKGPIQVTGDIFQEDNKLFIAVGSTKIRKSIADKLQLANDCYNTIIHPSAIICETAKIGYGTIIMPGAIVNTNAVIGNHCIINSNAVIEHDNEIGDFTHIASSATLAGCVKVGMETFIGAGATIIPGITIGKSVVVGAGTVVIRDIENNRKVVGNPAREI